MLHLITGGARSGKSALAETLAGRHGGPVSCLVTADVRDTEFAARVAAHRARRPAGWQVVETGQGLAEALSQHARPDGVLLVDCLGMWLMRFLDDVSGFDSEAYAWARAALLATLVRLPGTVLVVTNEIGWGVVPLGAASRLFVDELGRLNQAVAALADRATLVTCGLPLELK
ncbi:MULTISPECIES: bifunctional adenosylcobinamide kinase/adenosylcobinamide-phosphate guanylyltransferase [Gulbenkiania]|uniref:Bifunctional adenosylcobalamin biosynthesis protein n=2 Tax=Gulbenkiania TaxID=397456 RepID=A0A0K6GU48_9NEIS|nr:MULTISPECIES: bifunctional adenosylcobinamide kinase/adenosylcobinamide-phosphate guanylyltransferase [Gulbenkiania]TCW31940.1 adenosylcobinamide kinase /adenosylcobinamide-phosphate guanylyltransferase [Gulbenkiania mobilis]CUA82037.1 adenosylcobinamide kinase [Gulbenkiania indica]